MKRERDGIIFKMQEIERKYLVKDISKLKLESYEKKTIIQVYVYHDKITTIRKRMIEKDGNVKYVYTAKIVKIGKFSTEEIEKEISKELYDQIQPTTPVNVIKKNRYIIPIENNLKIELDVFDNEFKGIIFAEIEFPSEEMAEKFVKPEWFGAELSGKITNNKMAHCSRNEIDKILNNY